jgi:gluconokinase
MSYFIGLDIGTGSTKALAIEEETKSIIKVEYVSYPTLSPKPYYSEQAPEIIWQAFRSTLSNPGRRGSGSPLLPNDTGSIAS